MSFTSGNTLEAELAQSRNLVIRQQRELAELFGFETRNKYGIYTETGQQIAFAAEQQKGFLGIILRQFLGHWRSFDLHIFDMQRKEAFIAHHPFRWFFQRLEVRDRQGRYLGATQRKFSILTKRFALENAQGLEILQVSSPIWRIWTFDFERGGRKVASIKKRWSGMLKEVFTDTDNFVLEMADPSLQPDEKALLLASSIFVDLMFFEKKGGGGFVSVIDG